MSPARAEVNGKSVRLLLNSNDISGNKGDTRTPGVFRGHGYKLGGIHPFALMHPKSIGKIHAQNRYFDSS